MSLYATKSENGTYRTFGKTEQDAIQELEDLCRANWAVLQAWHGWSVVRVRIIEQPEKGEEE